jgi:hypothetical protein
MVVTTHVMQVVAVSGGDPSGLMRHSHTALMAWLSVGIVSVNPCPTSRPWVSIISDTSNRSANVRVGFATNQFYRWWVAMIDEEITSLLEDAGYAFNAAIGLYVVTAGAVEDDQGGHSPEFVADELGIPIEDLERWQGEQAGLSGEVSEDQASA